jgi:hypothetical protein
MLGLGRSRSHLLGQSMSWMPVASLILGAVALLFVHLYRSALRENRGLVNYALLILLGDGVCGVQRKDWPT